jgi:hypothetical protein
LKVKHYARVENGKLIIPDRERLIQDAKQFEGKSIFIILDEEKQTRSNSQNRYYHGVVLKLISDHTGFTIDETHELMLEMFADKSEKKIGNETYFIKHRSHSMKTDRFEKYLEDIRRFAAIELQVEIPLPNEVLTN